MLGRVKNSRERNWLKAFIRRLTSLADDLLEHPEVRKSECLRNQKTKGGRDKSQKDWNSKSKNAIIKNHVLLSQKNIPTRRSHMPSHVEVENPSKPLQQNQSTLITKPETNQRDFVTEEMSKIDGGSRLDNSDDLVQQLRIGPPGITDSTVPQQEHPHGMIDVKVWSPPKVAYESTSVGSSKRSVTSPQSSTVKEEVLQKLLGEMASQVQKLKDLGGTEEDMLNLWKENGSKTPLPVVEVTPSPEVEQDIPDFAYDEQGAATGELRPDDSQQDLIVALSVNKVVSTMSSIPIVSSSSGLDVMNEFYPTSKPALEDQANDEDDLVRQLQEEKFLSEGAPKSASPDYLEKDFQSETLSDGVPLKKFDMGQIFG